MGNLLDRFCIACGIGRIWKDKTDVPSVPVVENTDGGVLVVDSSKKLLRYGNLRYKIRRQVALVLERLLREPTHIIFYTDLDGILGVPGYFDGSLCSRQRVRTLKRDLRKVLNGLPFDIVRSSADCLRLVRTDGHPLLEEGETDNM